ncbi:MAG: hypothetical protein JF615_10855, partial [Asticcacaulis sp.]|nr:hypothetical protein [Asticcacaulis sp.]
MPPNRPVSPRPTFIGASQILSRSQPLTERQAKLIGVLGDSATALMELINQILDLSKIEARNLQLEQAPFDVRDMVDEIVRMMTLQAGAKSLYLTVRSNCACISERLFVGDAARIRQILVNLTGNAIKFTESGGITICIACDHGDDPETEDLVFTVADTGI